MKNIFIIFLLTCSIVFISCKKENPDDNLLIKYSYTFEAVSKGVGGDCKTNLIQFTTNLSILDSITGNTKDICYAPNLPENLKPAGTKFKLNIRKPYAGEILNCTTMGPAYGQVYILESELIQTIK